MSETLSPGEVLSLLQPKRSKYGVRQDSEGKRARTVDGILYDSAAEARYAVDLEQRRRMGEILSWERQIKIDLPVNGVTVARMVIDFRIRYPDGSTQLVEVKGHETPAYKLKRKLFRAIYGYDFTIVKV